MRLELVLFLMYSMVSWERLELITLCGGLGSSIYSMVLLLDDSTVKGLES